MNFSGATKKLVATLLVLGGVVGTGFYALGGQDRFLFSSAASPEGGPIGFVGCSNSRDAVLGYYAVGETRFWFPPNPKTYGGGTVSVWSDKIAGNGGQYWGVFDALLLENPDTQVVWLSLCTRPPEVETDAQNYAAARAVITEIERRIPGVTVYVSALNGYAPPHVCSATGEAGPQRMETLADRLAAEGHAERGPQLGSLISGYQVPSEGASLSNSETVPDGCHPNEKGKEKLGKALASFFSGVASEEKPKEKEKPGENPPPTSPPPDIFNVTLEARPTKGAGPLEGVDFRARPFGSTQGPVTYTIYCNRPDSNTRVTEGWSARFSDITKEKFRMLDVCNYQKAGTYVAKVIAERGGQTAEARIPITVEQ